MKMELKRGKTREMLSYLGDEGEAEISRQVFFMNQKNIARNILERS
jgi:hypothetical protein